MVGMNPQTFYQSNGNKFHFPLHPFLFRENEERELIDLDSLELMNDKAIFDDWKLRPLHEEQFDQPGHLNPNLDFDDEDRILEGHFFEYRRQRPIFQNIQPNIIDVQNPPFNLRMRGNNLATINFIDGIVRCHWFGKHSPCNLLVTK